MSWSILRAATCLVLLSSCAAGKFQRLPAEPPPVTSPAFATTMAAVAKTEWTEGNRITTLQNGVVFFPAMLKSVRSAKETITFESFVNIRSLPVHAFSMAFIERARAGVKVHLILDAFGSRKFGQDYVDAMRGAGVEVEFYSPLQVLKPACYNHRTHRRVLVVDGRTGFTGGAGWVQLWLGDAQSPSHWRDTQYELHGPVVRQLQDNFNDNWEELTGHRLTGPGYYPPLARAGSLRAQMVLGSPEKAEDTIGSSNLLAIRAARTSVLIEHSYFIPPHAITQALATAATRGVRVEIMVPGKHTDMRIARPASLGSLRRLIEAGAILYEYQPTMMHGKLVIVDEELVIAGSGNLDARSFFINDENNLHVLGAAFAAEQKRMFEHDKTRCKRLGAEDLKPSFWQHVQAGLAGLTESQL